MKKFVIASIWRKLGHASTLFTVIILLFSTTGGVVSYTEDIVLIGNIEENIPVPEVANIRVSIPIPPMPDLFEHLESYQNFDQPENNLFEENEITELFMPVLQEVISNANCYFKSWMDWRSITYRNSRQWRMQQIAYTCDEGFRRVDGLYMIALGTYFLCGGVGDVFDVTLSTGITFRAVVGDIKCDRHTDITNRFHLTDGSVVEFIVDRQVMCQDILSRGNISFSRFYGNVTTIKRLPELFIEV